MSHLLSVAAVQSTAVTNERRTYREMCFVLGFAAAANAEPSFAPAVARD